MHNSGRWRDIYMGEVQLKTIRIGGRRKNLYDEDISLMDSGEDWEGMLLLSINIADQMRKNYLSHSSIKMSMNSLWLLSPWKQKTYNHQKREENALRCKILWKGLDEMTQGDPSTLIVLSKHS